MRRFHSYGPVDPTEHFCVPRDALVEQCVAQLVGSPEKGGHFFTLWAPRQTGKTWLMRRAIEEIQARHSDRFAIGALSMQGMMAPNDGEDVFFRAFPAIYREGFVGRIPAVRDWQAWLSQFERDGGLFDRPTILLIDEFDSLPRAIIDRLVSLFRKAYLSRSAYHLHSLALIGVRAVLGVESDAGSPFNVQRSLQVCNLSGEEVEEMFQQYERESRQRVEEEVRLAVYEATRGQPGLVSWFGELLTEKHNPGIECGITMKDWERTLTLALSVEWNNTVLNLVKKAQSETYFQHVLRLFSESQVPFSLDKEWCNYLYLNGILDYDVGGDGSGTTSPTCRFSSPFVQRRLYNALTDDFYGSRGPVLALEPGDLLEDVFQAEGMDLPALLERYKRYLSRLTKRGFDPFRGHPRRKSDLNLPEAVGHFHLYAWLREAIGHRALISPEFPTGNGKVDLVIRHEGRLGVIEVKSFHDSYALQKSYVQTARYARQLGLDTAALVVFVPVLDKAVLEGISGEREVSGLSIVTVAIGWG